MAIKVSNTTVIDDSRNLTNIGTVGAAGDVTLSSTGHIKVPVGTEAQRTGSPAAGMFRYNSTAGAFEGYTTEHRHSLRNICISCRNKRIQRRTSYYF